MSPTPYTPAVKGLPRGRRRFVFLSLVFIFVVAVPLFVFYATGYRYNFFSPDATITSTGGMYLTVDLEEADIYFNEEPVRDLRIFRSASYLQNILPGVHRVHVQAPGMHTWVKELPVYPHIVTEAEAFLLPIRPQIRPITEFTTSTGTQVFLGVASTTVLFDFASTTIPTVATSSKATTTLSRNSEYTYVKGLFGTTTATTTAPRIAQVVGEVVEGVFGPSATSTAATTSLATTTVTFNNLTLFERGDDVFVRYDGPERSIPYYFCIPQIDFASSSAIYSAQVIESILAHAEVDSLESVPETSNDNRICREEIMVDRQWQEVLYFTFLPGNSDVVLMHRADGIFATELDDRSWQNTQRLYPKAVNQVMVDGGRIYVRDGDYFFELLTTLPTV